jgi:hypothetical protein
MAYMSRTSRFAALILTATALVSCSTLPTFDGPPGLTTNRRDREAQSYKGPVPSVYDIVKHIQCEIWQIPKPLPENQRDTATAEQKRFDKFWLNQYVVYAILTIDVTDDGRIDPSVSFIQPLAAMGESRSLSVTPSVDGTAHRNFTVSFVLDLTPDPQGNPTFIPPDGTDRLNYCKANDEHVGGLTGDLGIKSIIEEGIKYRDNDQFVFPTALSTQFSSSTTPTFGSTIDFTMVYGLGGGPNWTLTHFTGPSGSGSLLGYTRTRKDTLVLSFASLNQRAISAGEASARSQALSTAADAARNSATVSLLQHILPQP